MKDRDRVRDRGVKLRQPGYAVNFTKVARGRRSKAAYCDASVMIETVRAKNARDKMRW